MKIHKEGKKIIPIVAVVLASIIAALFFTIGQFVIFYAFAAIFIILFLLIVWFFREPPLSVLEDINQILAVSDGEVVAIEPTFEREYFKEERIQVSVFMSVFNVHINRNPVSGKIVYSHHRKGRFLPAFIAKSSEENERCTTVIEMKDGTEILVRQIAGMLARRVITYRKQGEEATQGRQLGFIRFGSRVDLFLPKNSNVQVKLHQKVFGGKSVIATFD